MTPDDADSDGEWYLVRYIKKNPIIGVGGETEELDGPIQAASPDDALRASIAERSANDTRGTDEVRVTELVDMSDSEVRVTYEVGSEESPAFLDDAC